MNIGYMLLIVMLAAVMLCTVAHGGDDVSTTPEGPTIAMMLADAIQECNKTYPVNEAIIKEFHNSGSIPDETQTIPKCYINCVMQKSNAVKPDGEFDVEVVENYFLSAHGTDKFTTVKEFISKCQKDSDEEDECDRIYAITKCIKEEEIRTFGSKGFAEN